MNQFFSLLCLVLFPFSHARIITSLEELRLWTDSKYLISNASVDYIANDHFRYYINFDHDFKQDIPDFWSNYRFFLKINAQSQWNKVMDNCVNFCKYVNKRNGGNFVANFITSFVRKNKDPFNSCPIPKKFYKLRNMTLNSENLDIPILKQVLGANSEIVVSFELAYQLKIHNKLITIFNVTYTGKVKSI